MAQHPFVLQQVVDDFVTGMQMQVVEEEQHSLLLLLSIFEVHLLLSLLLLSVSALLLLQHPPPPPHSPVSFGTPIPESSQHDFLLEVKLSLQFEEGQHPWLLLSIFGAHFSLLFSVSALLLLLQHPLPPPICASGTFKSQQDFFLLIAVVTLLSSPLQHDDLDGAVLALQTQFFSLQHTFLGATLGGEEQQASSLQLLFVGLSLQHNDFFGRAVLPQPSIFSLLHDFSAGGSLLQLPPLVLQHELLAGAVFSVGGDAEHDVVVVVM